MTWNWIFKSPLLRLRFSFCPFQKTRFYPSWRPIIPWHILWDMSPQPFNLSSCDGEVSKNSPASHTPLPQYETLCRIADSLLSFIQSKVFISILYFFIPFSCWVKCPLLTTEVSCSHLPLTPIFLLLSCKGKFSKGL